MAAAACTWVKRARANGTAGAKQAGPAKKPASGTLSYDDVLEEENMQVKAGIRVLELERDILLVRPGGLPLLPGMGPSPPVPQVHPGDLISR
ncbi:hypothetical protein [Nonomuraea jiangxiensis]|uniref:Uncharacterized protein n=1 Tax=Nonomuraea jiangxiensis TaxID=633440 RepID=A0A1G8PWP2_9ACTN|nr:hypothetical protein [Nonomuraea jiangxiensis]SDI96260.1 hypothetical protein SAMN05421869_10837 [Nonomuraea jiangxiensis]